MARYRLYPTSAEEHALLEHCAHARFVWNLAVEQHRRSTEGQRRTQGFGEHCRQLTEARAESAWLASGSCTVQQQALKDFAVCTAAWRSGRSGRPSWRKRGRHESFRIVAVRPDHVRRTSRRFGSVFVPKVGHVRFRWSRPVRVAKSFRIKQESDGRWYVAFATVPASVPGPGNGAVVGLDRGVVSSVTLSTGEMYRCPMPRSADITRRRRLQRRLARAERGSNRRQRTKRALGRLTVREVDRRRDWIEKLSTELARRFDLIRVEDLRIGNMVRSARGTIDHPSRGSRCKARLDGRILSNGWGLLVRRLEDKAAGRVERVHPAFTSQRCSVCSYRSSENRKSQAVFLCGRCGHRANADVNAARNIAAGRVVTARGGGPTGPPVNREPRHSASLVAVSEPSHR
ncbi:putative transposase IS891/IS1136/IS1341 family [Kribbella flavida DSM 17836]|uniref:Putative transposase IS891/IS1136/IS1341 family n=1 Tax=Kribbella flavida (strain DSM 17836 / JCM 10339 / NBRC 14399) TaxID=479435 RepID=D2PRR2_KRIFD|nr:RNA-guided endonuclease TnpB family protein [Kribbella flavida]ADB29242.1 putative transposase IS891/IS1136/IS1341 family [Kribbella flavida DSM 17836]